MKKTLITAAAALFLVACGGGDDDDSSSDGTSGGSIADADVVVIAKDIRFDKNAFDAAAGDITLGYVNEGVIRHTLLIEDVDGFKLEVKKNGDEATGTVNLTAGTYLLYCDVPGHRPAMEATLTVV